MIYSTNYAIRPNSESSFTLDVFKTGLLSGKRHIFLFERYSGEVVLAAEKLESSQVAFVIETDSLVLKDDWVKPRDQAKIMALVRDEILEVARHREIRFDSTKVAKTLGEYSVTGSLTIKGISKPAYLEIRVGPNQAENLELEGNSQIKLSHYNLKRPSALLGAIGTRDEMAVRFSLVAWPAAADNPAEKT
jgi:polyisoprenoid-binding protein YceI